MIVLQTGQEVQILNVLPAKDRDQRRGGTTPRKRP